MELQIQDLVSTIKKEGIDAANAEAERMIADAKAEAASILAKANSEAEKIEEKSRQEIEVMKDGARVSIEHAKRDAMLSFKAAVQAEFEKILSADTEKAVQGETLAALIKAALQGEDPANYAAEVAEVSEGLKSELAAELKKGLEIRPSKGIRAGFRLAAKDDSGFFDCSDAEIADMLQPFFPELSI